MKLLTLPGLHYLLSRFGPRSLRSRAFDAKFQHTGWDAYCESDWLVNRICEVTPFGGSVAILGCGANPLGRQLAEQRPGLRMVGVDLSREAIAIATLRGIPMLQTLHCADMRDFNTSQKFDTVVFPDSLYFLPRHAKTIPPLLAYWKTRLNPGGRIIVSVSHPEKHGKFIKQVFDQFMPFAGIHPIPGGAKIIESC